MIARRASVSIVVALLILGFIASSPLVPRANATPGTFVQKAGNSTMGSSPMFVPFSSNVTKGDLLLVTFGSIVPDADAAGAAQTVTDSLGSNFSLSASAATYGGNTTVGWTTYAEIFYGVANQTGADTITVNYANEFGDGSFSAEVYEFAGYQTVSYFNESAGGDGVTHSLPNEPTYVTSGGFIPPPTNGSLLIAVTAGYNSNGGWTKGPEFTTIDSPSNWEGSEYNTAVSGAGHNATMTYDSDLGNGGGYSWSTAANYFPLVVVPPPPPTGGTGSGCTGTSCVISSSSTTTSVSGCLGSVCTSTSSSTSTNTTTSVASGAGSPPPTGNTTGLGGGIPPSNPPTPLVPLELLYGLLLIFIILLLAFSYQKSRQTFKKLERRYENT